MCLAVEIEVKSFRRLGLQALTFVGVFYSVHMEEQKRHRRKNLRLSVIA